MLRYPTPSDQRYRNVSNPPAPQGNGTYWSPAPDGSHSAVTREPDDRHHPPPRLRANQIPSSAYASASAPTTTTFAFPQRDTYPAQTQTDCPAQYPYPPQQQYPSAVNYSQPPFDLAEYPVSCLSASRDTADHLPRSPAPRTYQVAPITVRSTQLSPLRCPAMSILILLFNTLHMTPRAISPPTFHITPRLTANTRRAWRPIIPAICVMTIPLTPTPPLASTQSHRFLPPRAPPSLETLS